MKILTKTGPQERNQELLDSIRPPYRVRITLQVKNAEGDYKSLAGSVLLSSDSQEAILGLLDRLEGFLGQSGPQKG